MTTGVWSNSDIGSILTAQELTRKSYLILSPEIATLSNLWINHLLHTSPKSKTCTFQAYFLTSVASKSQLGLQFPQWTMKGKEYGRKRQCNAIRCPCSYLGIEKNHEKLRKISVLAENQTGYLPIKVRSSTQLAWCCLFKHWGVQSPVQNGTLRWEPKPVFSSVLNCATGQEGLSTMEFIIHPHRLVSLL